MSEAPGSPAAPGDLPPRRRLERAPSERFQPPDSAGGTSDPGESTPRTGGPMPTGTAAALGVGVIGAVAVVIVYGVLATTVGLLAIAGATGFLAGLALRGSAAGPARAVGIAAGAVIVGIVGGWLVSLAQGGVVGPVDYVAQTLGPLAVVAPPVAALGALLGRG